jgi:hypothetical protein
MEKFSIHSPEHRANEAMFWAVVDGAGDKYRATLAMRTALSNAADSPSDENGFWGCAISTFGMVYDCIVEFYPNEYKLSRPRYGGRSRAVRIRK